MDMIRDKLAQAVSIRNEQHIDAWLTFVHESATMPDPMIDRHGVTFLSKPHTRLWVVRA
jgi:hypothetical protein